MPLQYTCVIHATLLVSTSAMFPMPADLPHNSAFSHVYIHMYYNIIIIYIYMYYACLHVDVHVYTCAYIMVACTLHTLDSVGVYSSSCMR